MLEFVAMLYDTSRKCNRKEKGQEKMPFSQCGGYRTKCCNKAWNLGLQGGVMCPEV